MVLATRSRTPLFALALLGVLGLVTTPVRAAVGDMYITGDVSNTVRMYTGVTASFLGNFTLTTNSPLSIDFGTNNNRVLVGGFTGGVFEYNATTGAYIKTYGPSVWQWSGIYRANGNVLVAETANDKIVEYDGVTGAFIQVFATIPGGMPSDMRYGPNGNLYVGLYGGNGVVELDPNSGSVVTAWMLPPGSRVNDVEFLNGEILVTALGTNLVYRYDSTPVHNLLGTFGNPFWGNTHGIEISPHNGHIYVVDGVTAQVHEFDPLTFIELNSAVLSPPPGDKIVDIAFRPQGEPTPAANTTWGRIKSLQR